MTISFWAKATSNSTKQYFLARKGGSSDDYEGIGLGIDSNNSLFYRFDAGVGTTVSSTGSETFTDDAWTHYILQTDLTNELVRVYVNGVLIREAIQTEDCNWIGTEAGYINSWIFGRGNNDSSYTNGNMSNVRFYSEAKNQVFINALFEEGYYPKPLPLPTTNGLIGHYPLTGTAEDTTGNYDGVENGNIYVDNNEKGSVADFDAVDDYIDVPLSASMAGKDTFSVSSWFRTDNASVMQTILSFSDNTNEGTEFVINVRGDKTGDSIGAFKRVDGTSQFVVENGGAGVVTDGLWHNFVFVSTPTGRKFYVDGVEYSPTYVVGNATTSYPLPASINSVKIGCNEDNGGTEWFFDNNLADIRVYEIALDPEEITDIYNYEKNFRSIDIDDGLTAYYPLKNNSKDNYYNEYDGADTSMTYNGESADFNGVSSFISLNNGLLSTSTAVSVAFWIKTVQDTSSKNSQIIRQGISGDNPIFTFGGVDTTNFIFSAELDDGDQAEINVPYANLGGGDFHHVVLELVVGSHINIYIDGVLFGTDSINGTILTLSSDLRLGSQDDNDYYFDGNIANVRFYNKTLSIEEIKIIYDTEKLEAITPRATANISITGIASATAVSTDTPIATGSVSVSGIAVVLIYPKATANITITGTANVSAYMPTATANITITGTANVSAYLPIGEAGISIGVNAVAHVTQSLSNAFTFVYKIQRVAVESRFKFVYSLEQPKVSTIIIRV